VAEVVNILLANAENKIEQAVENDILNQADRAAKTGRQFVVRLFGKAMEDPHPPTPSPKFWERGLGVRALEEPFGLIEPYRINYRTLS
jgi:hypothetical protein